MKLSDYMRENGLTDADMASRVGLDRTTILRWRTGKMRPSWSALDAIVTATGGKVTPQDFVECAEGCQ